MRLSGHLKRAGYPYVLNNLGDHLTKRRLDLGLNQKQAASLLGCHATSIANWATGATGPGIRHWPSIIRFLGYDPRPRAEAIGDRLKHHRTALGLSRESAARQLRIDAGTLGNWEHGRRQPEGKYLAKVYAFLGEDPRPMPASIADRLKRYREALGWSQRELARRLGVYPTTVERWELGQRRPSPETLARIEAQMGLLSDDAG